MWDAARAARPDSSGGAAKPPAADSVVVLRAYRDGDLPDIDITHTDLLCPLQVGVTHRICVRTITAVLRPCVKPHVDLL